jgi:hypothetical protein
MMDIGDMDEESSDEAETLVEEEPGRVFVVDVEDEDDED